MLKFFNFVSTSKLIKSQLLLVLKYLKCKSCQYNNRDTARIKKMSNVDFDYTSLFKETTCLYPVKFCTAHEGIYVLFSTCYKHTEVHMFAQHMLQTHEVVYVLHMTCYKYTKVYMFCTWCVTKTRMCLYFALHKLHSWMCMRIQINWTNYTTNVA